MEKIVRAPADIQCHAFLMTAQLDKIGGALLSIADQRETE